MAAVNIFQLEPRVNGWCPWDVQSWFNAAVDAGWLPIYQSAALASGEDLATLMADGIQEGGFSLPHVHPDGRILGDRQHAVGIHQLHLFGAQTVEGLMPPAANIAEAARRLAANSVAIAKWLTVNNFAIPPEFTLQEYINHLTLDAYNRGLTGEEKALPKDPSHPDAPTAGGRYATDILARAVVIEQLLEAYNQGD